MAGRTGRRTAPGRHNSTPATPVGRIIVGVDGSDTSVRALHTAIDHAPAHDATPQVVCVLPAPAAVWTTVPEAAYPVEDPQVRIKQTRQRLQETVDRATADGTAPPTELRVTEGSPVRTLLQAAEDADLLVVGSRGLGGFRGLLLGSVSQQCVSHAPVPVMVVPAAAGAHS